MVTDQPLTAADYTQYPDYPCAYAGYQIINDNRMHYLESVRGSTDTIVMLHGNPSWSFYYRHLFTALCKQYHCIVPDHIGMGLSDKPQADQYAFTLKQRTDDLELLLKSLNVTNKITLIVHDWGGMIGMAYATRYPQLIKRLVILNTASFHMPQHKSIPWQLKLGRMPYLGRFIIQGLNAFCKGAAYQCVTTKPMHKVIQNAYLQPYNSWANRLAVLRFVEDIPLTKTHVSYPIVTEIEQQLTCFKELPILICWGLNDFVFDRDYLIEWQRHFPQAECHEFDAGHYLLEDAGDKVIPLIQAFLGNN